MQHPSSPHRTVAGLFLEKGVSSATRGRINKYKEMHDLNKRGRFYERTGWHLLKMKRQRGQRHRDGDERMPGCI